MIGYSIFAWLPKGFSQRVLDELGQGHPRCSRLCFRLHEKLIVDIDGGAHRLFPHRPVDAFNTR
jgi:hypothetical protein